MHRRANLRLRARAEAAEAVAFGGREGNVTHLDTWPVKATEDRKGSGTPLATASSAPWRPQTNRGEGN